MATQNFINECKNRANANRLGKFDLKSSNILEAEGSNITLNDVYSLKSLELNGDTYQQTYTGKNLNVYPYATTGGAGNGITFTINTDGTVILNGKNNGNGNSTKYFYNNTNNPLILLAGTYYMAKPSNTNVTYVMYDGTSYYNFNNNNNYSWTFNEQKSIRTFYIQVAKNNTTQFSYLKVYPMLSTTRYTENDYEPYVGGVPSPSPNYTQNIECVTGLQNVNVCGKNLIDEDTIIPAMISSMSYSPETAVYDSTTKVLTMTNPNTDTYIPAIYNNANNIPSANINVKKNTTYTLHLEIDQPSSTWKNCVMGLDKSINRYKYITTLGTVNTITFNTENYDTIAFRIGSTASVGTVTHFSKFQLEESSTVSEYEEYKGQKYEINLGKNLIPNNITSQTLNGLTITKNDDSSVTIDGTCNYLTTLNMLPNDITMPKGQYTLSGCPSGGGTNTWRIDINNGAVIAQRDEGNGATFTLDQDTVFENVRIRIANGAVVNNLTFKPMLEKGSTATTYSPYFTPIELNKIPETEYEDSIKKSSGKNLFNKDNIIKLNGTINNNDNTFVGGGLNYAVVINCKPNTTYTVQKRNDGNTNRFALASSETIPSSTGSEVTPILNRIRDDNASSLTLTTGATAKYLVIQYYRSAESTLTEQQLLDSIQAEENTETTEYEPYLPKGTWYLEKQTNKIELAIADMNNSENYPGWKNQTQIKTDVYNGTDTGSLSNYTNYKSNIAVENERVNCNFSGNNAVIFLSRAYFGNDHTQTYWKTNYPNLVFSMVYGIKTPEYTEITNTELINQLESIKLLKGLNNITITSGDLSTPIEIQAYDTEYIDQSNKLVSMEFKDSCCINNEILGSIYTKSADVKLLDLPINTELEGQTITPEVGIKYSNNATEYITFDDYTIESINDEQTGSNTEFTAMNGSTLLDKEYECSLSFENSQTHTINEFYQDACNQAGLTPTDTSFDNSTIVMTGNPFTNRETIRTVISEVEKVSCSIAKFDWKNKTISLTWLSDQIDYEFNTSDYSTLEGSLTQYGPLNVIIIGNSQLNGENVTMTDSESVAVNGEHQIMIDSPYFLYTEALRTQAIQAIYNKLDGLTYYDIKLTTPYGKPFLEIGNKIRINTNENQVYDTYVLSHTFKYDGTFNSIIESPALTTEEQTIKNEFKTNSITSKVKRTELMVDKVTGDITALTERITTNEANTYSKEQINELVQNATEGVTNKFITNGGNNILRNTGLWFEDRSEIDYMYPSNALYPDDDLYMSADPHYEYWKGNAKKTKEDKAVNLSGILLQLGYLEQEQQVRNGTYTLSFKYRKLIQLANCNMQINDTTIQLIEATDTEVVLTFNVSSLYVNIKLFSDTDDACVIYDLMLNSGSEKSEYSQHPNETTTETVNISKGITITSSDTNTTFKANTDGIRVYNNKDLDNPVAKYTDTGMETNRIKVDEEAQIVQVLWKNVGNNTWISRL